MSDDIHAANARDLMRDMPDEGPSEDDVAEALRAASRRAMLDEREACALKAREHAAHYPQGSDGRNTLILLAEWIENRTSAQS